MDWHKLLEPQSPPPVIISSPIMPHLLTPWFSSFLTLWPFNTVLQCCGDPPSKNLFSLLLHDYNFVPVTNRKVNICYVGYLICNPWERVIHTQRGLDPHVEKYAVILPKQLTNWGQVIQTHELLRAGLVWNTTATYCKKKLLLPGLRASEVHGINTDIQGAMWHVHLNNSSGFFPLSLWASDQYSITVLGMKPSPPRGAGLKSNQ